MRAVFTYTWWRSVTGWIGPAVIYLLVLVVLNPPGAGFLNNSAIGVFFMLPLSIWISSVTIRSEGASQAAITQVNSGSFLRFRIGSALAALSSCSVLALCSVVLAWLRHGDETTTLDVALALVAHLVLACVGCGVGLISTAALVSRPELGWLAGATLVLLLLAVPISPVVLVLATLASGLQPPILGLGLTGAVGLCLWLTTMKLGRSVK